jgi:hypothetical protein
MTTLGNQLAIRCVRMITQVERQIADPLAVEGSVQIPLHQHSVFREAGLQTMHGIDFKPCPSESCGQGTQSISQRIVAPAPLPGGYSVGVPPDPIPNSAVKPACANGTIAQAMEE